jgi:hypothetical protein
LIALNKECFCSFVIKRERERSKKSVRRPSVVRGESQSFLKRDDDF